MRIIDKNAGQAASGIRLLAMDLDGTLLTDDKRFTGRCAEAVKTAAKLGMEPVYVTGRPFSGIPKDVLSVPSVRYVITSNGAVTLELSSGKTLRSAGLDRSVCERIMQEVERRGYIYDVIADGYGFSDELSFQRQIDMFRGTPLESYVLATRRIVPDVFKVIEAAGTIENLWIKAPDGRKRDEMAEIASGLGGTRIVITSPTDVEVGSPRSDKGLAVLHLAGMLGTEKSGIAAMGDNGNDLGMLGSSGLAVVMDNAGDDVKSRAHVIAGSNNDDGAAEAIEWICACAGK